MSDIDVSAADGVLRLRLNRPDKKNALTGDMYKALSDALEGGDASDDVRAHVIFGVPGAFSAGNDMADFLTAARGMGELSPEVMRFLRLLPVLRKPLIAGVDGLAIGIGTTLLMHCDLVYATAASTFATPFLDLGLVPEAASSLIAPRIMGYTRAFELLVLGEPFGAERARECGLINAVLPVEDFESKVIETAKRLAKKPPGALTAAKRLMRGEAADILGRIDEEAAEFRARLGSPEAAAAFKAFFEKRAPAKDSERREASQS